VLFRSSGRLPVTFYRTNEELPDFSDYSMTNRTYRYMKNEALYPFGYGLGYSKFEYSEIMLVNDKLKADENMECAVSVKNIGNYESDEIVQLYLKDLEANAEVPRWSLKGFKRVHLKPGKIIKVKFIVTARQMALINNEGKCILEPGMFEVFIGGSQPDERSQMLTGTRVSKASFEISGDAVELEY
jgi:beta-glucosidase